MTPRYFRDPTAPVQPDQFEAEFTALLELFDSLRPRRVLEIGVREGGSLYQWIKHAPGAEIFAIDQPGVGWGFDGSANPAAWGEWAGRFGCELAVYLGDSHSAAAIDFICENGPYDFVFIDGDHSAAGVLMDILAVAGVTCVIGIHDILPDRTDDTIAIWRVWPFLQSAFPDNCELTSATGQGSRGIGVLYA